MTRLVLFHLVFAAVGLGAAPTFHDLLRPDCLPDAQYGMRVESAAADAAGLRVTTTGARFALSFADGVGVFSQRIGAEREVLRLRFVSGAPLKAELTHDQPGFAMARGDSPRFDLRANGDSLFMVRAVEPLRLELTRRIHPGFVASWRSNHVLLDEYGGFGLYCSVPDIRDGFEPYGGGEDGAPHTLVAQYDLPADAVLWIAICPPKPYDWKRSVSEQVVWHWSNQLAYPPDDVLAGWRPFGNIVLLQSEVMLWKDWNLGFEPRLGAAEFARVRDRLHRIGMRFMVYTSPYYFLRGTGRESAAMSSFEGFMNWPAGTPTGENIDLFLAEIEKVMREYRPDGLYFDGQYIESVPALYLLARRARRIVGDGGLMEWHSTQALGPDLCSLPTADAYADILLRGEGRQALYGDEQYLRYFVSGYNVHNSIGVICNNGQRPTPELLDRLLDVNARIHTLAGWLNDPELVQLLEAYARKRDDLEGLRRRVASRSDQRQAGIPARAEAMARERRELSGEPAWGEALLVERFTSLAGWTQTVSPRAPDALTVADGELRITAPGHTFAFVERPIGRPVRGFVVQIRQGNDVGMSWGPAVCLCWPGGFHLRVGSRSDGLVQVDFSGDQRLAMPAKPASDLWLRVRWGEHSGVVEASPDGRTYENLIEFQHAGKLSGPAESIRLGKVPYHGKPEDYPESGPVGSCAVAKLALYQEQGARKLK